MLGSPNQMSAKESQAIQQKRTRSNWIVFAALAVFVVTVFALSFNHIRVEGNVPPTMDDRS